jgi:hypothetical protein
MASRPIRNARKSHDPNFTYGDTPSAASKKTARKKKKMSMKNSPETLFIDCGEAVSTNSLTQTRMWQGFSTRSSTQTAQVNG